MNEPAALLVRARSGGREVATKLSLVPWVPANRAQLFRTVGKLALRAVLAEAAVLRVGATKLCFVEVVFDARLTRGGVASYAFMLLCGSREQRVRLRRVSGGLRRRLLLLLVLLVELRMKLLVDMVWLEERRCSRRWWKQVGELLVRARGQVLVRRSVEGEGSRGGRRNGWQRGGSRGGR